MTKGIDIIDNYADLSIGKYMDICDLCREDSMDELDRQVAIIAILTGQDEDTILDLPIPEYSELAKKSQFLEAPAGDSHRRISRNYCVGEFELIPATDINKITTAQYIDFKTFSQRGENNIVELLSCFLVPKGKKYCKDYDVFAVQKAIREFLSVSDTLALSAFFLTSYSESMRDILTFSKERAMKMKDCEKKAKILEAISQQEMIFK